MMENKIYEHELNENRELEISFNSKTAKRILTNADFAELKRIMSILKDAECELLAEKKRKRAEESGPSLEQLLKGINLDDYLG